MSPEERKQVTILSSAIGVVLLGGAFWVRSIVSDPSQKPSSVPIATPSTIVADNRPTATPIASSTTDPKQSVASTTDATPPIATPPVTTQSQHGNPFRKVLAGDAPTSTSSISLADAQAKASANANRRANGQRSDYPSMGSEFTLPDARSVVKPFQPTEALNESFKLEGIVSNEKGPMAVVTYGGTTIYVRQGETFGDGIHVDTVHRLFATFSRKKKVYRVDVGGGLQ